jgi:hypothetical protein
METSIKDLISVGNVAVFNYDMKGFDIFPLWLNPETQETFVYRFSRQLAVQPTGQAYHDYAVWSVA